MKPLITYIYEKIKITSKDIDYKYFPKNNEDLQFILLDKIKNSKNGILDVSDIDITNNEINILNSTFSFDEMKGITEIIGLENWDISNITEIQYLFSGNRNLVTIKGLENWDTSNIKDMSGVFFLCCSIKNLDLSGWNMQSVQHTRNMFAACSNLKSIGNISNWKIKNISDPHYLNRFRHMFDGCKKLKLDISNWNLPNKGRNYVTNSPNIKKY